MSHIHLNLVAVNSPTNHIANSWMLPDDAQAKGFADLRYWCDVAKILERGRFDAIFFADTFAVPGGKFADDTMASGGVIPRPDPWALIPALGAVTRHLGFAITLSTVGVPPYLAVRKVSTADLLTGGRVAWNVVTSYQEPDFKAVGLERTEHDLRYDQADEYMEICYRLWDGFPREAVVCDREAGVYIDTSRIKKVSFKGKFYSCDAYPFVVQSAQGRPLIFQAGASERGMRFAAQHADAVFALQPLLHMKSYVADVNAARKNLGLPDARVFFGIQPFLGGSEAEARKLPDDLEARVPLHTAIDRLSLLLGKTFRPDEFHQPIAKTHTDASQGWMKAIGGWLGDRIPTLAEVARYVVISPMTPRLIGTPEQVADRIVDIWRSTGCYGFMISPNVMLKSLDDFVSEVVPILQKRGLMRTEYAGLTFRENLEQSS
jgi:FMN-dependent oxidoreductase (nitrilotriacetate monooxygenase family)